MEKTPHVKIAALQGKDRSKVKKYWAPLWGPKYSTLITTDFKNEGKSKPVEK